MLRSCLAVLLTLLAWEAQATCGFLHEIWDSPRWISSYWLQEKPRVINISSGIPRGGLGDVAPNLLMARELRRFLPSTVEVRVVVEGRSIEAVERLLPDFQPGQDQMLQGLRFLPESARAEDLRADFGLVFSSANGGGASSPEVPRDELRAPMRDARYRLSFSEPVSQAPRFQVMSNGVDALRFRAGAKNFGYYVTPKGKSAAEAPMSRNELLVHLTRLAEVQAIGIQFPQKILLGFSYTFYRDATQLYLEAMREIVKAPQYQNQPVLIVVKSFEGLDLGGFPPHVTVLGLAKRPFQMDESLIAHADFPVMVTGDTSLSLAMEYGKPVFVENPRWKTRAIADLMERISEVHPEAFSDRRAAILLDRVMGITAIEDVAGRKGQSWHNPGYLIAAALDPRFLSSQVEAFERLRPDLSLLRRVLLFMEYMERDGKVFDANATSAVLSQYFHSLSTSEF